MSRGDRVKVVGAGVAAGLVSGLLGVGGGVLLVPALVLVLARPQHVAHATSLVAVTMAAVAGVARFGFDGAVAPAGAALLASGSVLGARIGADLAPRIREERLRTIFAVALLVVAVRFLIAGDATGVTGQSVPDLTTAVVIAHLGAGFAAGVTSSLLGVGGGIILVPVLAIGLGYGQHIAEGTSLAVIVPTALTGALRHARNGYTDWGTGVRLGGAAVVGSLTGASIALGLDPAVLGRVFGVLLVVIAALTLRPVRTASGGLDEPASWRTES